jgi:signal transduction histidine kinase
MADLYPPMLDEYGLVATLRWYSQNFSQKSGIATRVVGNEFEPRLPAKVEMYLFRFVQEALNNVLKHARANQVVIGIESSDETAYLKVQDNGQGFDPQSISKQDEQPHWGLILMQQRASFIGGQVTIDSVPGQGTQISVNIQRNQT